MNPTICILGAGEAAAETAARLQSEHIEVMRILPTSDPPKPPPAIDREAIAAILSQVEVEPGCIVLHCRFDGGSAVYEAKALVVAEEARRETPFQRYGLVPGENALSLSKAIQEPALLPDNGVVVFLLGLAGESHPVITREVLETARTYAFRGKAYVLTRNLKVAAQGLEALVQECRTAGVVFVKFTDTRPVVRQADAGMVIEFTDEQMGQSASIQADRVVVDECFRPSETLSALAEKLRLETDADGFLQADNVHRLPVFTNRQRVFVVGPSRGAFQAEQLKADIARVILESRRLVQDPSLPVTGVPAFIQPGRCVRCLTCYRVCPYGAIGLKVRPEVLPDACQRCGICMAECPAKAIALSDIEDAMVFERIDAFRRETESHQSPFIVVFGCERSAKLCRETADEKSVSLPERLCFIDVPCAGRISLDCLLGAFNRNADGVLVLTCHEGNCHSGQGNLHAKRRIAYLKEMLAVIGMNPDRLHTRSLAANMPVEFAAVCRDFTQFIQSLTKP